MSDSALDAVRYVRSGGRFELGEDSTSRLMETGNIDEDTVGVGT